jgi:hypothetical protein
MTTRQKCYLVRKLGVMVYVCSPSTGDTDCEFKARLGSTTRPCLSNKKKVVGKSKPLEVPAIWE